MGEIKKESVFGKELTFNSVSFVDGFNGMKEQTYRNEEFGITVRVHRPARNTPWEMTFTMDLFGDRIFKSKKELEEAFKGTMKP